MNNEQTNRCDSSKQLFNDCHRRVKQLYQAFDVIDEPAPLAEHIDARARSYCTPNGSLEAPNLMTSTYFRLHLAMQGDRLSMNKTKFKRFEKMMDELEQATICHHLSFHSTAHVQNLWTERAALHLQRFEMLKFEHLRIETATRLGRQKGGHTRIRHASRLRRLAMRFLRTQAPKAGWKNIAHASTIVGPLLSAVALKHKLHASMSEETWIRNVGSLIGNSFGAAEVFQRHRRIANNISHGRNL